MRTILCPHCERQTNAHDTTKKETYPVKGEQVEIDADVTICKECGRTVFDEEKDGRNLARAFNAYRQRHDLLSPADIRRIREKYGLSQRAFSRFLGWGEITVHRYESGALQDAAHNNLLSLLDDPRNMLKLCETQCGLLSSRDRSTVEKKIELSLEEESVWAFEASLERLVSHGSVDALSGFKDFDYDKLKNLIIYFAKKLRGVFKVKLNKLLWYADFLHFKETSVSITGCRYVKLPYGPVPDKYDLIIDTMVDDGALHKEEVVFDPERDIVGEKIRTLQEPDMSMFTKTEIKVVNAIIQRFRSVGSGTIANLSHQERAYQKTKEKDFISYEYAKDLSISLGG